MRRRRLLGYLSALVTAGLIGAVLPFGSEPNATELRDLRVSNHDDEPHVVHLQVEHDGDLVHRQSYDVEGMQPETVNGETHDVEGGMDVPCTWPTEVGAGGTVLRARVDDRTEWETTTLTREDGDCLIVDVQVERDGELAFWTSYDCEFDSGERTRCGTATTE